MGRERTWNAVLMAAICAAGIAMVEAGFSLPASAQLRVPNFQLGLPLGTDDSLSQLHSDRTPELHINWLYKEGKVQEGLQELDKLLEQQPDRPLLWLMRAYGHELAGQYTEALNDFDKAQANCAEQLKTDKRMELNLMLFKGIALNKLGKNEQALDCFNKVIQGGGDASAYYARGLVYQDLMDSTKAIENFNLALKANPNNAAWLEGRAFSYCTLGEFSKALADCDRAAQIAPSHLIFETRAWAHHGLHQYDKAIEDTDKALALEPDSVIAYWRRGLAHLAENKSKDAVEDFDRGLAKKRSSLLLRDRALAEIDLKQYDQALKDATASMEELGKEAQPYRIRALAEHAMGEFKKAMDDWNVAVSMEPDDAFTYARRGNTYLALGDWTRALKDFTTAEKHNSQLSLHAEKSRAYRHMKKLDEALSECDSAIKQNPNDETAYEARARIRLAQWRNDDALKDADMAIKVANDPKWINPNEVKALVYSQREQWIKESNECDKTIAINPDEATMFIHRSYANHRLGEFKKAIDDLNEAIKLEPTADNYAARADANLYVDNFDGAISDANQSLKLDPENSYAFMARGAAYGHKGDKTKMRDEFQTGLKLDKEPAYAHATIAEYYMDLGMDEDAVKEYTAAVEAEPTNAQLYRWLGQALLKTGRYKEALTDFDKAVSMEPNYPVAYAFRAEVEMKLDQYDKAIADCNKAVSLDDSCILAYKNRAAAYEKTGKQKEAAADRELATKLGK